MHTANSVYREYDLKRKLHENMARMMAEELSNLRNKVIELEKKVVYARRAESLDRMGK